VIRTIRNLLAVSLIVPWGVACAEVPAVTSLFPRGASVGSTTEIAATGKLGQPGTVAWCSNPGIQVTVPDSGGNVSVEVAADARPGLCWIRFHNAEGATTPLPFVLGRLPEVREAEPNNELSKAQAIEKSTVVNGKLQANGDVDVFAVTLKKDQTLIAAAEANWRLGSPVDMVLQVVTPTGEVVAQVDDDRGNDPLVTFTAPADGVWYVRTFGFPAAPNSSIRFSGGATFVYRLTMTTGPLANHSLPSAVPRESDMTVKLTGWNLPAELQQPLNPDRDASCQVMHALLPQPLPVAVVDGRVAVVQEPCDKSKPLDVETGTTVCGVIEQPRDEDTIRFTATKGQKLVFRVESRSLGYPLDAELHVFDAEGNELAKSDDAKRDVFDPLLKFTPKADGQYSVRIRDVFRHGGWRYAWRMHIEELKPGVTLSVKADRFTLTPDKPLEIPVTISRNNGFAEEFEVTINELPPGVTAEPVKSAAKGDTAKSVTIKLTVSESKAFSGPIQIIGHPANGQTVAATAPLATLNLSIDQIWLTVLPKKEAESK
jgi:hypothetical protein